MSLHLTNHPPILSFPVEMTDVILTSLLNTILPIYDDAASLWSISPDQWSPIMRAKFEEYFHLRLVCPGFDHRIIDLSVAWSFLPLGQMDGDDLTRAITRSNERPLTVLVTDADSVGLLWPLLQRASRRIRTLYIDLDARLIGAVSTSLQFNQFDQLRNLFLGARGSLSDGGEMGSLAGMTGGWSANGLGTGPTGARRDDVPMSRRPNQASHTRDLARLHHIPVTALCLRHSSFPFDHFRPPPHLRTLHIHKSHGGRFPFELHLHHFHSALRSMQYLSELELWEVDVIVSTTVEPVPIPSLCCVAVRGTVHSVSTLAQYLRPCALDVLVTELVHHQVVLSSELNAHALATSRSFTMSKYVLSVGMFLNVNGSVPWHATIDLVLKTPHDTYMSMRIPAIRAHIFAALLLDCMAVSPDARLSFDMTEGDDPGGMVHRIFNEFLPLDLFRQYHLCVQSNHVPAILQALEPLRPDLTGRLVVFHGTHRSVSRIGAISAYPHWDTIIRVADEDATCNHVRLGRSGRWVGVDGKEVFSSSVDLTHGHLMRMLVHCS